MNDKPTNWPISFESQGPISEPPAFAAQPGAARVGGTGHRRAMATCRLAMALELGGLAIQFLLGMGINLYVAHPHRQLVVVAHIGLGFTLVACALVAVAAAIVARNRSYLRASLAGAAALVLAVTGGLRFLRAGQHNLDSYLMAVGFLVAVAMFAAGMRYNHQRPGRPSSSSLGRPSGPS